MLTKTVNYVNKVYSFLRVGQALRVLQYGFFISLLIMAFTLFLSALNNPWNLKAFAVTSGSMEPAIKTGSLVFTTRADQYLVNDIITFLEGASKRPITHRIVGSQLTTTENNDIQYMYNTKGDVNEEADLTSIKESAITGKVRLSIPYIGYPLLWAKSQLGYIFLIIIPATVIVYSELLNIKSELVSIIKGKKNRGKITTLADI